MSNSRCDDDHPTLITHPPAAHAPEPRHPGARGAPFHRPVLPRVIQARVVQYAFMTVVPEGPAASAPAIPISVGHIDAVRRKPIHTTSSIQPLLSTTYAHE